MSFGKTNYRVGGTRGGAAHFKWEDVKNDKYRENYLGHSLQAPVGRWQKGKDLTWYAKLNKSEQSEAMQMELELARQRDEELMNEALGIAPKKRRIAVETLSAAEMKELLKRGTAERDGMDVERVEGLGAAPVEAAGFDTGSKRTLAERYRDQLMSGKEDTTYALPGTCNEPKTEAEAKMLQKVARKMEKAAKKLKKKEKKEKKERKKQKKLNHTEDSDESSLLQRISCRKSDENKRHRSYSRSPSRSRKSVRRSRSASRRHRTRSRSSSRREKSESPERPQFHGSSSRRHDRSRPRRRRSHSRSRN